MSADGGRPRGAGTISIQWSGHPEGVSPKDDRQLSKMNGCISVHCERENCGAVIVAGGACYEADAPELGVGAYRPFFGEIIIEPKACIGAEAGRRRVTALRSLA